MKVNLSANREIRDYKKEDAFDFKIKADAIRYFLEQNTVALQHNKMIALYGNWGSGKTSLMRHIEDEIDKDIYCPVFFEAWAHEKDENLALSLCDAITSELEEDISSTIKNFRKAAMNLLKGFTSALSVKVGGPLIGSELTFEGDKLIQRLEGADQETPSFFVQNAAFKDSFLKIEELLLNQKKAVRILVFVDDLDRCEPENVLNLITALKLFFTYGKNTIFFAGLDKEAITKAVETRYKDVIKSEEYLEKVFDISFGMPKVFSLDKFLTGFFYGSGTVDTNKANNIETIADFFRTIRFTNPRHIKKVLNKYEILVAFNDNDNMPGHIRSLIPELITRQQSGHLYETILCLYFIILYENFPHEFEELEDYRKKLTGYVQPQYEFAKLSNQGYSFDTASRTISNVMIDNIENVSIEYILNGQGGNASFAFFGFLLLFTSPQLKTFTPIPDVKLDKFSDHFPDTNIQNWFCKFLINHQEEIIENRSSQYLFWNFFNMAKYLL